MFRNAVGVIMAKRILVVEDDVPSRDFISTALADEAYEVASVDNGQAALELIRVFCPDLILLDMHMPIMDGEGFLGVYQEMVVHKVPVIGLSATGRTEKIARALGVTEFLIKPVDLEILLSCVKQCLQPKSVTV
jgi:CheY-like chemotaxis protein